MARRYDLALGVDGLDDLIKALRAADRDVPKAVRKGFKAAVGPTVTQARALAPRRTGRLAASIKAGTSGARISIYSTHPGAGVHEYGGTIRPAGGDIRIRRSEMVGKAVERTQVSGLRRVEESLVDSLRSHGL